MITGLSAGALWALDTVILGIALSMTPFVSSGQAAALAPFVSTFLHDACSSLWMLLYMGARRQWRQTFRALKTRSGRFILLGALLGGPVGMTGYVYAIHSIGPAYTAVISSVFPAVGALLSWVFLKERMRPLQIAGLAVSILGVMALGYAPGSARPEHAAFGFACALLCCFGWAAEAVICAWGMRDPDVSNEQALQLRQLTSALVYGVVLLNVFRGWGLTTAALTAAAFPVVALSALFGTVSYLFYYKAIKTIGAAKAMALNITYSAWSILFSLILLGTMPDLKSTVCAVAILGGSVLAGTDLKELTARR